MAEMKSPEERASKRADDYVGLMWHLAAFIIINGFMWFLDWATGGGIEWAYWVTIPWSIGLAFHVAAYFIDDSRMRDRAYRRFLEEEQHKDGS